MKEYKLRVNLTVKRLLDCPLDGRSLYVKIKWAPRAMWGGKMDYTSTKPSQNRTIEWNETFTYECYVLLDTADTSHEEDALAKLRKKQDRMAYLRLSLRKEKVGENPIAARKRKLGFVDIPLVDWAILYGNQKEHNIRHLLDGTMSTTRLELAVKIDWLDGAPTKKGGDLYHSTASTAFEDSKEESQANMPQPKIKNDNKVKKADDEDDEASAGDLWGEYKMEEVADTAAKDSVQEALISSRLTQKENTALIDLLVQHVLDPEAGEMEESPKFDSSAFMSLRAFGRHASI